MNLLKKLRFRLTSINAIVSGIILLLMALGSLLFTQQQFSISSENAFAHAADIIAYQVQSETMIRHSFLSQTELAQGFLIYIEDGGEPFNWPGVLDSRTPRDILLQRAQQKAEEHGVDVSYAPVSSKSYASFIQGDYGDSYRMSVWTIPNTRSWSSVTILSDMTAEQTTMRNITIIFLSCAIAGIAALSVFSYLFAGRAIEPIEKSNRQQKQFVQAASHELRTPITVIQASADALIKADGPEALRFAHAIGQQTRHMARLVDDMLQLAGADTQTLPMRFAPVEIHEVLLAVKEEIIPLMHERGLELTSEADAPLPLLWGDETRIRQMLHILLDNAMEHTPSGGKVVLNALHSAKALQISVADTGSGVPDEHKPYIFDRFYRADKSRSREKAHYGLGLSVASEIMALHGGSITLSDREGGGAVFTLQFAIKE